MDNLGDLFSYTNLDLLDGELDDINDIISHLEEGQNKIAEVAKIEAPIFTTTLTSNTFDLPDDFLLMESITLNDLPIQPDRVWAGKVYFNKLITTGDVEMLYYRRPIPLDPTNLLQVPDLDKRYWYTLCQYAAEMYKIKDNDDQMVADFQQKFIEGLGVYSKTKATMSNFYNLGTPIV